MEPTKEQQRLISVADEISECIKQAHEKIANVNLDPEALYLVAGLLRSALRAVGNLRRTIYNPLDK